MKNPVARTTFTGLIILPALFIAVVVLFALLLGRLPNVVQLPPLSNLAFYQILWQDNPWETARLVLIEKPLLMVGHKDQATGLRVWGMFYYSGTLLVYLLAAVFTTLNWRRLQDSTLQQRTLFMAGIAFLLISVTYLRRVECCTGGPGWVLDTWLLAQVYMPDSGRMNWMALYATLRPWLQALQAVLLLGGIALLYSWQRVAGRTATP